MFWKKLIMKTNINIYFRSYIFPFDLSSNMIWQDTNAYYIGNAQKVFVK